MEQQRSEEDRRAAGAEETTDGRVAGATHPDAATNASGGATQHGHDDNNAPPLSVAGLSPPPPPFVLEMQATLAELRDSNQTLEAIIQASPLGIITLDPEGIVQTWNNAAERIYGWSEQEVLGRPLPTVPPGKQEEMRRNHQMAVEGTAFKSLEAERLRKDGTGIVVSISTAPLRAADGQTTGVVALVEDITARKEAGEALLRSEDRYRAFVEQSSEPIWRFELESPVPINLSADEQIERLYETGYLAECNDVMARMYGFSRASELVGTRVTDLLPRNPANLDYLRAAVQAGYRLTDRESQELDREGRTKYFLNNLVGIVEGGALRRVWGTQRDITGRKRAEEAERFLSDASNMFASSLDYEATLESVARLVVPGMADYCLVHMLEADGTIHRMIVAHQDPAREEAWREMQRRFPLDLNTPHTIAKVLRTGQPEIFPELTDEMLQAVIREPEEVRMLRAFNIKATMIMPLIARGRTLGALTFISAESARRYTDDDSALAAELARRAALAIDNARLYRRAQEANLAKDEFLSTLSHELRTPLTPIIGWVHMLSLGQLAPADITHGLAIIGKNAQSLAHLINDLLDMSAILSGKMRIDTLPVSLDAVVREAIETVHPQAAKHNIRLELSPCATGAPEGMVVSGDRTRLVQVFWNLLMNAVKFSRADGRVRVICEIVEGGVRVHVDDEGEGITAEFLPHVFERFRQQDMSTTKAYGGLGIGLALVKSFVEAHGGTVSAASAGAARGSRFTVSLPLLVRAQPTLPAPSPAAAVPATGKAGEIENACHALIIEDAPDTLEMLRVAFAVRGFRTTVCATPEAALSIAANERFDIIISDIGLPNINGYELLPRLRRETPYLRDVPALALTGYAAQKDVDAALAAGFSAHLAKPFDPATLAATVDALLKRRKSEATSSDE